MQLKKLINVSASLTKDEHFFINRQICNDSEILSFAAQNYFRICWVESGKGFFTSANKNTNIQYGNLLFIAHPVNALFTAAKNSNLIIHSLLFHQSIYDNLKSKYFTDLFNFKWDENIIFNLKAKEAHTINYLINHFSKLPKNSFYLDSVLLFILNLLNSSQLSSKNELPLWLTYALENFRSSKFLALGIKGFLQLTQRSLDHTNKELKKSTGKTLTETINQIRIEQAANLLMTSSDAIKTIAFNCGFQNLGHFYKVFKNKYTVSPNQFRHNNNLYNFISC